MTPKETILAAADLVRKGWCQGENHKIIEGRDCYCALGALHAAAGSDPTERLDRKISDPVYGYVSATHKGKTLVRYNDAEGRTQSDVIAILESAAASLDDGKEEHNDQT